MSHNLNVVRRVTARTAVMYLGQVVEQAAERGAVRAARRTRTPPRCCGANPAIDPARRRAPVVLTGDVPSPAHPPAGCRFHPRCPAAEDVCRNTAPDLAEAAPGRLVRCHFAFSAVDALP